MRELLFGPKRFSDLRVGLGASPNVLSQRLGELEAGGVVRQRSAGGALYELTDWGRELHPILLRLGRWGARALHRPTGELGVDALMVALESTFVPETAADLRATYELRLGEERFSVGVGDGAITIARGSPRGPDAVIESDPARCGPGLRRPEAGGRARRDPGRRPPGADVLPAVRAPVSGSRACRWRALSHRVENSSRALAKESSLLRGQADLIPAEEVEDAGVSRPCSDVRFCARFLPPPARRRTCARTRRT